MSNQTPEQSSNAPVVPDQLTHYLNESRIHDVVARWQRSSLDTVNERMHEPATFEAGTRAVRMVVLGPSNDEYDPDQTVVVGLAPHEAWRPATFMYTAMLREIIAPNGRLIAFPGSENAKQPSYRLDPDEQDKIKAGDTSPLAELHMRALEVHKIGQAAMTGYGIGGLMTLQAARQSTVNLDVSHLNLDEIPLGGFRNAAQLQRDIQQSTSHEDQEKSLSDSGISLLAESKGGAGQFRKGFDFKRSKQSRSFEQALMYSLASYPESALIDAMFQHRGVRIKLGHVAGSKLVSTVFIEASRQYGDMSGVSMREYSGDGTHKYATGSNLVARVLMAYDGIGRLS